MSLVTFVTALAPIEVVVFALPFGRAAHLVSHVAEAKKRRTGFAVSPLMQIVSIVGGATGARAIRI